jgi:hypothetical protein
MIVGGHEHSLQLHRDPVGMYYAVSGSASKTSRLSELPTQMVGTSTKGYMRLDAHDDGSLDVTVFALDDGESASREIYEHCIANGEPNFGGRRAQEIQQNPD